MLWLLVIVLLCANAVDVDLADEVEETLQTTAVPPNGPQVRNLKVSTLSPWAIFVSWQQPEGYTKKNITEYRLSGSINETRQAGDDYVFCFVDHGLKPGENISATMKVIYNNTGDSKPQTVKATMPIASKPDLFHI